MTRAIAAGLGVMLAAAAACLASGDGRGTTAALALLLVAAMAWRLQTSAVVVAGFVPIGAAIAVVAGSPSPAELLLTAGAAAGLLVRAAGRARSANPQADSFALALGALAAASGTALWWGGVIAEMRPAMGLTAWIADLGAALAEGDPGLRAGLGLAVGAATVVWMGDVLRQPHARRAASRMLLFSVAALAVVSIYRVIEVALRVGSAAELSRAFWTLRVAPIIGDPNALGAMFLLATPTAFHHAASRHPLTRWGGAALAALLLVGAWLAGSRTTLALTPVAVAATFVIGRPARRSLALVVAVALVAAVLVAAAVAAGARHSSAAAAASIRRDLVVVTARMVRDYPFAGVGVNRFYEASPRYMPDTLTAYYARENAHNQFLQIAGELGLPGLTAFLAFLGATFRPLIRRPDVTGWGAGTLAFLAAALAQHPLIDVHVAGCFFIALGLARSTAPARDSTRPGPRVWLPAAAMTSCAVVLLPMQAQLRAADVNFSGRVTGAGHVTGAAEGGPYWTTRRRATMYVPAGVGRCEIGVRGRGIRGEELMFLRLDHRAAGAFQVSRGEWRWISVAVPSTPGHRLRHHRLDVWWEPTGRRRVALDVRPPVCR